MRSKSAEIFTIGYLVTVTLLDYIGLGVVVTLFPNLFLDPTAAILPTSWSHQARLSALGIFLAIYPLGQFFGAAILGKLSDYWGRRKILLITLTGTLLGFIASGIAIEIQSAILLFISRLFAGLAAGNVAVVQASMADISPDEKTKNRNFSLLQIVLGASWVIGPPMGGWMSESSVVSWFTYTTPFWFTSVLLGILLLVTLFGFKETLLQPKKEQIRLFAGIEQIHHAFVKPHLRVAFSVWFIFISGWWLFEAFLPAYLLQNFHFSPAQIGTFLASMGATYAIFQLVVVQRFSALKPQHMVKGALIISGLSVMGIAMVTSTLALHIMITLFVTSMGFAIPGLITTISSLADATEQGQVMGMASSIQAFATVAMMMIGGFLEAINLNITVIGGGALLILSWIIFMVYFYRSNTEVSYAE